MEQELIIKNSHKRSKLYGIKKELEYTNKVLNEYEIITLKKKNKNFIEISKVYIDMIFSVIKDNDFIIILTDKDGCILYVKGDIEKFKKLNMVVGAYMDEKSVGTNAMGTALREDKSVQITANEHYVDIFQKLTCSASPIHDENGHIIGSLNLTGASSKKHPHTLGLVIFAVKAIENEIIKLKSKNIFQKYKKANEKTGATYKFNDLIGDSKVMNNIIANSKIIANSPSTVLLEGESGTGKEVLAQAIHNYSVRQNNKFVAVNCGALPKNLIEAELFGYEDGTFTGGKKGGKLGKFELANGGTLFLDEISEMSLDLQVILLRVLQEQKVVRLGGEKEIYINVRIIAATNKNLKEEVEKGTFREDLYYRLCVIPIKLPSLRKRREDIKNLIEYFLKVKSIKLNKSMPKLSIELYNSLLNHDWPGNIRQLENCIEHIVNLNGNISFEIFKNENLKKDICNFINYDEVEKINFNLEYIEKKTIIKAIKNCDGNLTKSSKVLGIGRNTLYLKIKKYDINIKK